MDFKIIFTVIKNKLKYFHIYFFAILVMALNHILINNYNNISIFNTVNYICIILIFLVAMYDFVRIVAIIYKIKFIKTIFIYIGIPIYFIADLISRQFFAYKLSMFPDNFKEFIYISNFINYIMLWFLCIFILWFIYFILSITIFSICKFKSLKIKFLNFFGFKNNLHYECFSISSYIVAMVCSSIIIIIYCVYINNYTKVLHFVSYYRNGNICKNISSDSYIKDLGNDKISISPYIYKDLKLIKESDKFKTNICK